MAEGAIKNAKLIFMDDTFEIPVLYKGEALVFPARLLTYGYSYKIEVTIGGDSVLFEPDEERNYRAVFATENKIEVNKINIELVKCIAETLHIYLS